MDIANVIKLPDKNTKPSISYNQVPVTVLKNEHLDLAAKDSKFIRLVANN